MFHTHARGRSENQSSVSIGDVIGFRKRAPDRPNGIIRSKRKVLYSRGRHRTRSGRPANRTPRRVAEKAPRAISTVRKSARDIHSQPTTALLPARRSPPRRTLLHAPARNHRLDPSHHERSHDDLARRRCVRDPARAGTAPGRDAPSRPRVAFRARTLFLYPMTTRARSRTTRAARARALVRRPPARPRAGIDPRSRGTRIPSRANEPRRPARALRRRGRAAPARVATRRFVQASDPRSDPPSGTLTPPGPPLPLSPSPRHQARSRPPARPSAAARPPSRRSRRSPPGAPPARAARFASPPSPRPPSPRPRRRLARCAPRSSPRTRPTAPARTPRTRARARR